MSRFIHTFLILFLSAIAVSCTSNASENLDADYHDMPLADVNGEILNEADFDLSQAWLPAFARQLESSSTLDINRFWSLVRVMLMAQEAQIQNLLSEAERSLAIKQALAKKNIDAIPCPNIAVTDAEIDAWLKANPDRLFEPESWTVAYALVKNASRILPMVAAYGLANGAQLGYNFVDSPELDMTHSPGPRTSNIGGHGMDPKHFAFAFANYTRENKEEPGQIGPFTAGDGLIFSCPEAIKVLQNAPIGQPIPQSIACSSEWKAFVIPIWHREATPMDDQKSRQIATDSLLKAKRSQCQREYLDAILNAQ